MKKAAKSEQDIPPYDHSGVVVVASIWLAIYVVMIVSSAIAPTSERQPAPLTAQARSTD